MKVTFAKKTYSHVNRRHDAMHVDKPETTVLMKASYGYMAKAAIVATARAYQKTTRKRDKRSLSSKEIISIISNHVHARKVHEDILRFTLYCFTCSLTRSLLVTTHNLHTNIDTDV
jgi:hypothetical protein